MPKIRAPKRPADESSGSSAKRGKIKEASATGFKERALRAFGGSLRVKISPKTNSFGASGRPTTYYPKSIATRMLQNHLCHQAALFGIEKLESTIKETDQAYLLTYAVILDNLLAGREKYAGVEASAKNSLILRIGLGELPMLPGHGASVAASASRFFSAAESKVARGEAAAAKPTADDSGADEAAIGCVVV